MVGADLANLVNEAALLAARRDHEHVEEADFTDALERIVLGAERQVMMSEEDRRRTAYHEGGHAIVGMLTPGADPVRKVSIIPRGMALGVTFAAPESDRFNYREPEVHAKIKVALGGRAAEEVVFGETSTGAESDIQQLTGIARQMVGRWGMSPAIGPVAVIPRDGAGPLLPGAAEVSPTRRRSSTRRCAASSTSRTSRWSRCCGRIGASSTRSRPRCSSTRRSTRRTPTRQRASRAPRRPPPRRSPQPPGRRPTRERADSCEDRQMTDIGGQNDPAPRSPASRAASIAKDAGVGAWHAGDALVDAVGALVDHTIERVLLGEERVTSAAEGKRMLAGNSELEARADKLQRLVVAAVPVVRVAARGARFTRVPWVMVASSVLTTGVAVRTGVRELQVLASLIAHRLEQAAGAPADPALVRKLAIDLYLNPKRTPDPTDDGLHLVRLSRRWVLSGAFGRNTSKQAAKALDAAERLDASTFAAEADD